MGLSAEISLASVSVKFSYDRSDGITTSLMATTKLGIGIGGEIGSHKFKSGSIKDLLKN